jgi:coproporphyrinogen III oxidase-like Fe-S oxidoreductase
MNAAIFIRLAEYGRVFEVASVSREASDRDLMSRFVMHNFFAFKLSRTEFADRFHCDPLEAFNDTFEKLERFRLVDIDPYQIRMTELGRKWRRNIYHEFRVPEDYATFPERVTPRANGNAGTEIS